MAEETETDDKLIALADEFNDLYWKAEAAHDKSRLVYILKLVEIRDLFEGDARAWNIWADAHLDIKSAQRNKLIVIGRTKDPAAELARQREQNRKEAEASRKKPPADTGSDGKSGSAERERVPVTLPDEFSGCTEAQIKECLRNATWIKLRGNWTVAIELPPAPEPPQAAEPQARERSA